MQGLLDFIKTPEGQGLLSGVFGYAANAQRGAPINSLGRGGLAGLLGYSNALERQDQQAESQWMQKYRQMQMDKAQYDMDRTKAADAEKSRIDGVIRSAITPVSGTQSIGLDAAGPTVNKAALIGQMPKLDPNALLAQGVPVERVKELIDAQNFGRQKVARTVKGIGPDGREYEYQVDEYGQRVGDGLAQYRAPIEMDTGGRKSLLDPYKYSEVVGFNKTMTPGERDASARGWSGLKLDREKFEADRTKDAKPTFNADVGGFVYPPDMRNPNGRIVKVDGAMKPPNESQGKAVLFGSRMSESNRILNDLESKGVTPSWSLGAAESVPLINGFARAAVNMGPLVSKDEQLYDQAKRDFINAVLRRESGAVISPEEFDNAARQYFPTAGDSKEVKEQKRRNREIALQGLTYEAGPHSAFITRNNPPAHSSRPSGMPTDIQNLLNKY